MFSEKQGMFSSRAFVCMADLLFGLSAGVLFLNAKESENLDSLPVLDERRVVLEERLSQVDSQSLRWEQGSAEVEQILKKLAELERKLEK